MENQQKKGLEEDLKPRFINLTKVEYSQGVILE